MAKGDEMSHKTAKRLRKEMGYDPSLLRSYEWLSYGTNRTLRLAANDPRSRYQAAKLREKMK